MHGTAINPFCRKAVLRDLFPAAEKPEGQS